MIASQLEELRNIASKEKLDSVRSKTELTFATNRIEQLQSEWQLYRNEVESMHKRIAGTLIM